MADGRHIENRFLADGREIRKGDEESHANTGHVTKKNAIFQNSRWRTTANLKTVFGV